MSVLTAGPLDADERKSLNEGLRLFDAGQFWDAHESWEDLWNMLKTREAPEAEILLVQGMIQTAAMLLHHERKNAVGVHKQWAKLQRKLDGWSTAWGLNIAVHLEAIQTYFMDAGTWRQTASDHQIPRA